MNKKIVGILLCMLMLATIPVAAGMHCDTQTTEQDELGPFSKTTVRGFILGASVTGRTTSFFAIRVKYTITNLFGEEESSVLILQRVTFVGKFTGYMGRFYISGTFRGTPR